MDGEKHFERNEARIRGHSWRIKKNGARNGIGKYFFSFLMVNKWNGLNEKVVKATNILSSEETS